jgi:hypothetical protein
MFHAHKYSSELENQLVAVFEKSLPETPPWKKN